MLINMNKVIHEGEIVLQRGKNKIDYQVCEVAFF
jgi:hypothetical protein